MLSDDSCRDASRSAGTCCDDSLSSVAGLATWGVAAVAALGVAIGPTGAAAAASDAGCTFGS